MHSPVIEMESESISEDDQTIGNIPMKMATKDQVTDQNQTNKVRKGILIPFTGKPSLKYQSKTFHPRSILICCLMSLYMT